VKRITDSCPLIEELSLTVPRTRGNAKEVSIYTALDSMRRLTSLSLLLDALDYETFFWVEHDDPEDEVTLIDPTFDEYDQQLLKRFSNTNSYLKPRNGNIRDFFINSALDECLARQIFGSISSGKPNGALPLERLKLRVQPGGHFSPRVITGPFEIYEYLGRSWLLERNPRDDRRDVIEVSEMRRVRGAYSPDRILDDDLRRAAGGVVETFRRLWPERWEGSCWKDDWHGWPLLATTYKAPVNRT